MTGHRDHDSGAAGGSAAQEYSRRRARDEAKVRSTWGEGRLGSIAIALTPERQSTRAWAVGAVGERRVGAALDRVAGDSMRVLHDRRIPGSKANIDHIVVTTSGVWVIDAKRYEGRRPLLVVEGGILRPRVEKLMVGRRDGTRLVEGVLKQVDLVCPTVPDVPVRGALCFVDADWPIFGGTFSVRGVDVLWPTRLGERLVGEDSGSVDVPAVTNAIAARFRAS